jgi:hypothetical protein
VRAHIGRLLVVSALAVVPVRAALAQSSQQLPDPDRERKKAEFILGLLANSGPITFRVSVDVSAEPNLQQALSSYLLRELRSLPNVVIVDSKPTWSLHVVSFETRSVSNVRTGYAVAVAITKPESVESVRPILDMCCSPPGQFHISDDSWHKAKSIFEDKESLVTLWLRTFGESQVNEGCSRIVAQFDSTYLEPLRRSDQETRERIEQYRRQVSSPPPQ